MKTVLLAIALCVVGAGQALADTNIEVTRVVTGGSVQPLIASPGEPVDVILCDMSTQAVEYQLNAGPLTGLAAGACIALRNVTDLRARRSGGNVETIELRLAVSLS